MMLNALCPSLLRSTPVCLTIAFFVLSSLSISVSAQSIGSGAAASAAEAALLQSQQLQAISDALELKIQQRQALQDRLKAVDPEGNSAENLKADLNSLEEDISTMQSTFELIALGNTDLNVMKDQDQTYDWKLELVEVVQPVLESLKSVTRKPREINGLRESINLNKQRLQVADEAIENISSLSIQNLSDPSLKRLEGLSQKWLADRQSYEQRLLYAQSQLDRLENSDEPLFGNLWPSVKQFLVGRGLTIALAGIAAFSAWFFFRFFWWFANRYLLSKQVRRGSTWYRLMSYSSYLFTVVLVILATMFVLYLRQDLLLLALALVILATAAIGLRNFLPAYLREARLLLNLGAVREEERVMFNGLPWQVQSLNIQTVLRNPQLEGVVRLPLETVSTLTSRAVKDTLWFPTEQGDYVLLPDGGFGQILSQTPDMVKLRVKGGMTQCFPSSDFYAMSVINISQGETFGVSLTFGLDYSHQGIALNEIPKAFREAIDDVIKNSDYAEGVVDVMVELNDAGASSLDYILYLTADSSLAGSYFGLRRLLLHTCVSVANQHGWVIPFPQMMVHHQAATDLTIPIPASI